VLEGTDGASGGEARPFATFTTYSAQNLENKASQHLASRDVALVRGAVQIWRSSMRGRRLVAYRDRRLLKSALKTWITTYRKKRDQLSRFNRL